MKTGLITLILLALTGCMESSAETKAQSDEIIKMESELKQLEDKIKEDQQAIDKIKSQMIDDEKMIESETAMINYVKKNDDLEPEATLEAIIQAAKAECNSEQLDNVNDLKALDMIDYHVGFDDMTISEALATMRETFSWHTVFYGEIFDRSGLDYDTKLSVLNKMLRQDRATERLFLIESLSRRIKKAIRNKGDDYHVNLLSEIKGVKLTHKSAVEHINCYANPVCPF